MNGRNMKAFLLSLAAALLLLLGWEYAAYLIDAPIILPSPRSVMSRLVILFSGGSFFRHLASTGFRVAAAFSLSLMLGIVLGIASGLSPVCKRMLAPFITSMRTIPVMAIILIAILWFPSGTVPVFAAVLMALPVVTGAVERGILGIDRKLLEMAWIFRLSRSDRFRKVIVPQVVPSMLTAAHLSVGLCWKVVIAGEILTIPRSGIGGEMQLSQLSLESEAVFAWTVVVVVSAALTQGLLALGERTGNRRG